VSFIEQLGDVLIPLTAITLTFVVVIVWLNLAHERRKLGIGRGKHGHRIGAAVMTEQDQTALEGIVRVAERMERRLEALEKILEADDPKWKERIQ
jgi:phage shock protein B